MTHCIKEGCTEPSRPSWHVTEWSLVLNAILGIYIVCDLVCDLAYDQTQEKMYETVYSCSFCHHTIYGKPTATGERYIYQNGWGWKPVGNSVHLACPDCLAQDMNFKKVKVAVDGTITDGYIHHTDKE